jgi:hypothetical protein
MDPVVRLVLKKIGHQFDRYGVELEVKDGKLKLLEHRNEELQPNVGYGGTGHPQKPATLSKTPKMKSQL